MSAVGALTTGARVIVSWKGDHRIGYVDGPVFAGTVRGTSYVPVRFVDTGLTVPDVDTRIVRPAPVTVWFAWHGGSSYAVPSWSEGLETAPSLAAVVDVCESRYHNRDDRTPAVDETAGAAVFYADPTGSDDPYPDQMIERVGGEYRAGPA